jgi:hypothetical protein
VRCPAPAPSRALPASRARRGWPLAGGPCPSAPAPHPRLPYIGGQSGQPKGGARA